ncbi:MAG: MBL fold metallo-hydrolase, partial [Elusimicrobia bacterium]|nr:MBL fold metallo-hydrolase [Elusimicrobiota bacterium]
PLVKVLLADKPASEQTAGEIRELLASFDGRAELLPEIGMGADKAALERVLEKQRPAVVVVRSGTKAFKGDVDFLRRAASHGVKVILRAGAGVDNVDLEEAARNGIAVARTHGNANSVANLALRFLVAGLRKNAAPGAAPGAPDVSAAEDWKSIFDIPLEEFAAAVRASEKAGRGTMPAGAFDRDFAPVSLEELRALFQQLNGKTIGLAGFGPIAQELARKLSEIRRLTGVSFRIAATSRALDRGDALATKEADALGVLHPGAETVLTQSEVLSLHLPSSRDTRGVLNAASMAGASARIVINTSREDLMDPALFATAPAFDYFADVDFNDDLVARQARLPEKVHLAPHIGASTKNAAAGVEKKTLSSLKSIVARMTGIRPAPPVEAVDVVNGVQIPAARPQFILDPFFRALLLRSGGLLATIGYIAALLVIVPAVETLIFQGPLLLAASSPYAALTVGPLALLVPAIFSLAHLGADAVARWLFRRAGMDETVMESIGPRPTLARFKSHYAAGLLFNAVFLAALPLGWVPAFAITAVVHATFEFPAIGDVWRAYVQSGPRGPFAERLVPAFQRVVDFVLAVKSRAIRVGRLARERGAAAGFVLMAPPVLFWLALGLPATSYTRRFVPNPPSVKFIAGAGEVGANATLVSVGGLNVLVDAGLDIKKDDPLPDYGQLGGRAPDAIVITHAHTDHIGSLPVLKKRFPGVPVYASPATIRLMKAMLPISLDTLRPYGVTHAAIQDTLKTIIPLETGTRYKLNRHAWFALRPAGHLLGARSVEFGSLGGHVVVSGDINLEPQQTVGAAEIPAGRPDLLVVESTMGDREGAPRADEEKRFIQICLETIRRGGNVIIPSLAMGRAQEVLALLRDAQQSGALPPVPVLYDGSISLFNEAYNDAAHDMPPARRSEIERNRGHLLAGNDNVNIRRVRDGERAGLRRQLAGDADKKSPVIVVAPAGMLNGGPIIDYLQAGIENPENRVVFVNYQPTGGLGGRLLGAAAGAPVRIGGKDYRREAPIEKVSLSGHASASGLTRYIAGAKARLTALVHGHPNASSALALRPELSRLKLVRPAIGGVVAARRPPLVRSLWRWLVSLFVPRVDVPLPPDLRAPDNMLVFTRTIRPFAVGLASNVQHKTGKFRPLFVHTDESTSLWSTHIEDRLDVSSIAGQLKNRDDVRALLRSAVARLNAIGYDRLRDAAMRAGRAGNGRGFTAQDLAAALGVTDLPGRLGVMIFLMSFPEFIAAARGRYTLKKDLEAPAALFNTISVQMNAVLGEAQRDEEELSVGSVALVESRQK